MSAGSGPNQEFELHSHFPPSCRAKLLGHLLLSQALQQEPVLRWSSWASTWHCRACRLAGSSLTGGDTMLPPLSSISEKLLFSLKSTKLSIFDVFKLKSRTVDGIETNTAFCPLNSVLGQFVSGKISCA